MYSSSYENGQDVQRVMAVVMDLCPPREVEGQAAFDLGEALVVIGRTVSFLASMIPEADRIAILEAWLKACIATAADLHSQSSELIKIVPTPKEGGGSINYIKGSDTLRARIEERKAASQDMFDEPGSAASKDRTLRISESHAAMALTPQAGALLNFMFTLCPVTSEAAMRIVTPEEAAHSLDSPQALRVMGELAGALFKAAPSDVRDSGLNNWFRYVRSTMHETDVQLRDEVERVVRQN